MEITPPFRRFPFKIDSDPSWDRLRPVRACQCSDHGQQTAHLSSAGSVYLSTPHALRHHQYQKSFRSTIIRTPEAFPAPRSSCTEYCLQLLRAHKNMDIPGPVCSQSVINILGISVPSRSSGYRISMRVIHRYIAAAYHRYRFSVKRPHRWGTGISVIPPPTKRAAPYTPPQGYASSIQRAVVATGGDDHSIVS